MSFCANCIKGVRHEGEAEGKIETISGVKVYVATPEVDYPKDKAILYLPDIFGTLELKNHQLMIDDFAKNGFLVYGPDIFEGEPIPADMLNKDGTKYDIMGWFARHDAARTGAIVRKVIGGLKEKGVTIYGAVGYCYGGRLVFDLAFDNIIKVAAVAHPSLLQPADLEKYAEVSKAPLLVEAAEHDEQLTPEKRELTETLLSGGKFAPGYKLDFFPGTEHGFAVRGDISVPVVREAKEAAFKNTVEWFIKYL